MNNLLDEIFDAARRRDAGTVQRILAMGEFTYRIGQSYCESWAGYEASEFIKAQATCECGNIVSKWDENDLTPKCGGCRFREAMGCIEYSEQNKK